MEIIPPSPEKTMEEYRSIALQCFPKEAYKFEIADSDLEEEMNILKRANDHERFILVINLKEMVFEDVYNVEKVLGYPDHLFKMYDYLKLIHPTHLPMHYISSTTMIPTLMLGNWNIEFMKERLITLIALKNKDGRYFLFRRIGYVWQYTIEDGKKKLLKYINEFVLINEYNDEPYLIRTGGEGSIPIEWLKSQMDNLKKLFENKNFFSRQELQVMREYINRKKAGANEIAEILNISRNTILTIHKRILVKAEQLFKREFDSAKEVAAFLYQQNIL